MLSKSLLVDEMNDRPLKVQQHLQINNTKMDSNYVQKLSHVFRFDCVKSLHLDDCKLYDQLLIPLFSVLSTNLSKLSLKNNYLTDNVIKMIVCNC